MPTSLHLKRKRTSSTYSCECCDSRNDETIYHFLVECTNSQFVILRKIYFAKIGNFIPSFHGMSVRDKVHSILRDDFPPCADATIYHFLYHIFKRRDFILEAKLGLSDSASENDHS